MRNVEFAYGFLVHTPFLWRSNWAWGLPLIVITVIIHVSGLGRIHRRAVRVYQEPSAHRRPTRFTFGVILGTATLMAAGLHAFEAALWATAYRLLGALPDFKTAMLYSLNAMTSYGHTNLDLEKHWLLMGAIESLNGWLLFGLSTAFLFAMIQRVWLLGSGEERR